MYCIEEGTLRLFTYRDGILSSAGHDLRMTLARFRIQVDQDTVVARFSLESLVVDGAVIKGRLSRLTLLKKERQEIRKHTLSSRLLDAAEHPEVVLHGTVAQADSCHYTIDGSLAMAGRKEQVQVAVTAGQGRLRGEVALVPSQWGIKPFSALLGTMKTQDRVDVVFDLPDPRCHEQAQPAAPAARERAVQPPGLD